MSAYTIRKLLICALIFATIIQYSGAQNVERKIIVRASTIYSQAVQVGNTLYISGNIGMTVDGDMVEGLRNQTHQALDNIGYILEAAGASFSHVVKVTVTDLEDYDAMNEIYGMYFMDKPPARATFAVAALVRNALVEIEAFAVVGNIVDQQSSRASGSGVVRLLPLLVLIQSLSMFWKALVEFSYGCNRDDDV